MFICFNTDQNAKSIYLTRGHLIKYTGFYNFYISNPSKSKQILLP